MAELSAKGIGEPSPMCAVWIAVNNMLKPFGAKILHQPFTPVHVLDAIARGDSTT